MRLDELDDAMMRLLYGPPPFDPNPPLGSGGGGSGDGKGKGEEGQTAAERAAALDEIRNAQAVGVGSDEEQEKAPTETKNRGGDKADLTEVEKRLLRERDERRRGY